jgi:hypothetical protein
MVECPTEHLLGQRRAACCGQQHTRIKQQRDKGRVVRFCAFMVSDNQQKPTPQPIPRSGSAARCASRARVAACAYWPSLARILRPCERRQTRNAMHTYLGVVVGHQRHKQAIISLHKQKR